MPTFSTCHLLGCRGWELVSLPHYSWEKVKRPREPSCPQRGTFSQWRHFLFLHGASSPQSSPDKMKLSWACLHIQALCLEGHKFGRLICHLPHVKMHRRSPSGSRQEILGVTASVGSGTFRAQGGQGLLGQGHLLACICCRSALPMDGSPSEIEREAESSRPAFSSCPYPAAPVP